MNTASPFLEYGNVKLLNVPHAAALAEEVIVQDCYRIKSLTGRWAVADIGACYGEFAFFAKSLGHFVIAAEASTVSHQIIGLNEHLNGHLSGQLVSWNRFVMGAQKGAVNHSYRPHHPAGSGPDCGDGISEKVMSSAMSLIVDFLIPANCPIFIKLDVEGAEVEIFEHLDTWIGPVSALSMETHNNDADVLGAMLEKLGFKVELWGTCPYPVPKWTKGMIGGMVIARK